MNADQTHGIEKAAQLAAAETDSARKYSRKYRLSDKKDKKFFSYSFDETLCSGCCIYSDYLAQQVHGTLVRHPMLVIGMTDTEVYCVPLTTPRKSKEKNSKYVNLSIYPYPPMPEGKESWAELNHVHKISKETLRNDASLYIIANHDPKLQKEGRNRFTVDDDILQMVRTGCDHTGKRVGFGVLHAALADRLDVTDADIPRDDARRIRSWHPTGVDLSHPTFALVFNDHAKTETAKASAKPIEMNGMSHTDTEEESSSSDKEKDD